MANKSLFASLRGKLLPSVNAVNDAGGSAYRFTAKHALSQYAMTGCLSTTYYVSEEDQLAKVLELCAEVEPEFIAKLAICSRAEGHMKDLPAMLCAVLSVRAPELLAETFRAVITDAKMLRNFVQIMRSGAVGRKSLGTLPKKLVLEWFARRSDESVFKSAIGADPSLADVIKMVHPKPMNKSREALYGYLLSKEYAEEELCGLVREYEQFKRDPSGSAPDVPFQMLTSLPLEERHWIDIAKTAAWQMTRMNLNTFARHGVFASEEMTKCIAERLRNPKLIRNARVFPYQLLAAYVNAGKDVPHLVREALQDALEIATSNVPAVDGQVVILPDVSGSMRSPVTGHRKGAASAVRCVDVAALVAATFLRTNPTAQALPFEHSVVEVRLNPRDSIMTNAQKLAAIGGGGTNCSAPLALLNQQKAKVDLVVFVSDNESWIHSNRHGATQTMKEWSVLKERNPSARMVCIDIQPNTTSQAESSRDVLNVGGFSDHVFSVIAEFAHGRFDGDYWVKRIEGGLPAADSAAA